MNDQKIELSLSLVNGVLQYLGTRPYGEVFQIIKAIQEQASSQVQVMDEGSSTVVEAH